MCSEKCSLIIDTQVRSFLIGKYAMAYASTGFSLSIEEAQRLLERDTGIKEKEGNVRNTMAKLAEFVAGFSMVPRGLRYESEKQLARRLQAERDAELRSAEDAARKANEHLALLRKGTAA